MPTVDTPRGTRKLFYTLEVNATVVADGDTGNLVKLGYANDGAIAAGSYPNPEDRLTYSKALAETASFVRRFQSSGKDVIGIMKGKVFGADADNPVVALPAAAQAELVFARVDTPDPWLRKAISLANASTDQFGADEAAGDNHEDV